MNTDIYFIGRVPIAITSIDKTVALIHDTIESSGKGYVCVSNMRTVTLTNKDDKYYEVMEQSLLNVPDGMPLVWCGKWWGIKDTERVCGPKLFTKMLTDKNHGFRHFFLGDTDHTLQKLTKKTIEDDHAEVCGYFSPPFKPLEDYDLQSLATIINNSGANVVWTSLRAPKQDFLAHMLIPLLHDGIVVVGVGAAFRAYLGELKVADGSLLQKTGLSGFVMKRDGRSVWSLLEWYAKNSLVLASLFIQIKWKRLLNKKSSQ